MEYNFEYFQISQAAIIMHEGKCLILEFASSPGYWGLPGGRIDKGESAKVAFSRELKEEIGCTTYKNLGLVDSDIWYIERTKTSICAIISFIESNDPVILSDEHLSFAWIDLHELDEYTFLWPNAKQIIKKGFAFEKG